MNSPTGTFYNKTIHLTPFKLNTRRNAPHQVRQPICFLAHYRFHRSRISHPIPLLLSQNGSPIPSGQRHASMRHQLLIFSAGLLGGFYGLYLPKLSKPSSSLTTRLKEPDSLPIEG
jgi:hypothetical protein